MSNIQIKKKSDGKCIKNKTLDGKVIDLVQYQKKLELEQKKSETDPDIIIKDLVLPESNNYLKPNHEIDALITATKKAVYECLNTSYITDDVKMRIETMNNIQKTLEKLAESVKDFKYKYTEIHDE